jgi:protein O-mannosyl-transferase
MRKYHIEVGISCALTVMTLAVFGWCCKNDFLNYDDILYVTKNPLVQAGLTWEGVGWAFTTFHAGNWHPLTWLSLELDSQIYGTAPWGFHLSNVLLHSANTIVLFWALRVLTGRVWSSAMVAALFAVHPLHVESVAWVAERKDVLSSLFWMLALLAYAWYVGAEKGAGVFSAAAVGKDAVSRHDLLRKRLPTPFLRYLAVVAAMGLGLLAKPMLVTLPFVFLLLDYWPLCRLTGGGEVAGWWGRGVVRRDHNFAATAPRRSTTSQSHHPTGRLLKRFGWLVIEKLPLFALSAGSSVVTWRAQSQAIRSLTDYPFPTRLANALLTYCAYIGQSLWPVHLGVHYPHPAGELTTYTGIPFPLWQPLAALLFLLGVSVLAVSRIRSMPYLSVGWFWYLGTLVPVIGLVQLAAQARADRYTYIPLIGLFVAVVWGIAEIAARRGYQRPVLGISVLILILLVSQSFVQVSYWHNSGTLWQHALDACGESTIAHTNLAWELRKKGKLQQAAWHDQQALLIQPTSHVAHNQLGVTLFMLGQKDEAFREWDEALRLQPDWDEPHLNRAVAFSQQGRKSEAIAEYEQMIRQRPDSPEPHFYLALLLIGGGRSNEVEGHFRAALAAARAKGQRGLASRIQETFDDYRSGKTLRINPEITAP